MAKTKESQESQRSGEGTQGQSSMERYRPGQLSDDLGSFGYSSPFTFMRRFSEEMDRIFEDLASPGLGWSGRLFGPRTSKSTSFAWAPQIETFQRGNEFVLRADLPGLSKDDVNVEVEDDCVAIRGERKREYTSDREDMGGYRTERSYGQFYRCVRLPEGVQPDQVSATFRDGVLEVKMPAPQQKQAKKVEISS